MIALIDQYQKELLKVNAFAASTVETYTISIKAFCSFVRNQLEMNPVKVKGPQLLKWILYLKNTGIGHSRIENHHYALKSFFAFVKKNRHNHCQSRRNPASFDHTQTAAHKADLNQGRF